MPAARMSAATTNRLEDVVIATEVSLGERLAVYRKARERATEFLLDQIQPSGAIGPVGDGLFYYRVPWALAVAGETGPAMKVTEWIRRHMLTPAGEIRGEASPDAGVRDLANTYAETCVAYGAQILRRYDVARPAMDFAVRYQDPVTGGVFSGRDRTAAGDPQIVFLTCQLGMSALLTGHEEAARRAGRFLQRLWQAQPELPERLYTMWTRDGGLVTITPPGADERHVVNDSRNEREYHYNGGMVAAFLGRLYMFDGDAAWLELARAFQDFSMRSTELQFETRQVCKSAWGAAVLSMITGERKYADWLLRMGDWFVAIQDADGAWRNTAYLDPNPTLGSRITVTAEFIVHLDSIEAALAATAVS